MIRKPGSDKGPGFSISGAYVCELIEGYVKLRFTHADIEVYESEVEVYARYRGLARILLCLFTRLLMQKKKSISTQGMLFALLSANNSFSFLAMLLSLPFGGLHILLHSVC